jgi:RNA polymerase subunit RPABC4/transcription elongation factor Spt4
MTKLEEILSKWDFRKIVKKYLIVTISAAVLCIAATIFIFKDKISFAWQYQRLTESIEKNELTAVENNMDQLSKNNQNIIDILVLKDNNEVIYSANHSIYASTHLDLKTINGSSTYVSTDTSADTVFKIVKKEKFLLASIFSTDYGDDDNKYQEQYFYEENVNAKNVYLLNYLGHDATGWKAYIILNPTIVANGNIILKIDAAAAMLAFMCYWVLLALWVYHDASKKKLYAVFWGIIVLFTNIIGLLVYFYCQRRSAVCPYCGSLEEPNPFFCSQCGKSLSTLCPSCKMLISSDANYCPHCGNKVVGKEQEMKEGKQE